MSAYPPPDPYTPGVFNPNSYTNPATTAVTEQYVLENCLSFPFAQGAESLVGVSNQGDLTNVGGSVGFSIPTSEEFNVSYNGANVLKISSAGGTFVGSASTATNATTATTATTSLACSGNSATATNATNAVNATTSTTQPLGTSTTAIATTAFVLANQGTVGTPTKKATLYLNNINQSVPLVAPYPTINIINFSALNYWDAVQFKVVYNLMSNATNTLATNGTGTNPYQPMPTVNWTFSSECFSIYPKAFIGLNNADYATVFLNNMLVYGASNVSTYSPTTGALTGGYTNNGRLTWAGGISSNDSDVGKTMGIEWNVINTNSLTVSFVPNPLYYNLNSTLNYTFSIEVLNTGKIGLADISTSGFTTNF